MATFNPYSGGDAVVNSTPFTQYYLQDLQKRQAKRDALDQYYNNLTKSVNTAGVRHQDIEGGLAKKIDDWRDFRAQNKEAIINPRKDNYKSLNEFQSRYQDILNDTEKSKQAAQMEMEIGKKVFDMKKDDVVTDDDLNIAQRIGQSIYHPDFYKQDGHTPYSLNDLTIGTPMAKQADVDKFLEGLAGDLKPTTIGVKTTTEKRHAALPVQPEERRNHRVRP
jgi:hypothetical protein